MPELKIIGVSATQASVKYLVLASQVVGLSTGKGSRAALSALHNFIRSTPSMIQGGDLATSFQKGEINAMIYTHHIHNGAHPSYFFTIEGVEETLRSLPNQLEDANQRFRELFDAFRNSASVPFNLDTANEGQIADDDDDMNESRDLDIIPKMLDRDWCYRFALQNEREKAELKLQIKDAELEKEKAKNEADKKVNAAELETVKAKLEADRKVSTAELKAKDAEIEKEKAKHEAERMRWEMEKLQANMSRVREHRRSESAEDHDTESEDEDDRRPVVRKSDKPRKLKSKLSHFAQMRSVGWDNDFPGVNFFADLPDDVHVPEDLGELPTFPVSKLIVRIVNGTVDEGPDTKQFVMALHYKGRRVSKQALLNSFMVKEAYGVEADGLQYLCLILYKNNGRRLKTVANVFYDGGIVPRNVTPELILDPKTGESHHISVFKVAGVTDDPVLTMIKKPCYTKWKWFNTKWGK